MDVKALMKAAEDRYFEEVSKVEKVVRDTLLIPFCDKHNVHFDSGMGVWNIESDLIMIYGANNWELSKKAKQSAKDDDAYEALNNKAQAFINLPETKALISALEEPDMKGCPIGSNIGPYNPQGSTMKNTCPCKGTGLIPPTSELPKGEHQVYCPKHKCKREWPQLQADGSVEFKELGPNGLK